MPDSPLNAFVPYLSGHIFFFIGLSIYTFKNFFIRLQGAILWLQCMDFSLQRLLLAQSMGFKTCWLQQLWHVSSVVAVHGFGAPQDEVFPRQGIKPISPACQVDS